MQSYEITDVGKQIAHDSGLEGFPEHLLEINLHSPLLVQLTDEYANLFESYDEIEETAIQLGRDRLKTRQERLMFERALHINPEQDYWKRTGELAEDTLFPNYQVNQFMPAKDEDRFILSGIVGLQLVDFRRKCHLLARSRYEEYGFKSFNESCAFVGAFIVSALYEMDRKRTYRNTPSFTYTEDGVTHKILMGGDLHGDFRMSEAKTVNSGIISPINTETEFSPIDYTSVSAYHSVEPGIVESMLIQELVKGGKEVLTSLVDEFVEVYQSFADETTNSKNSASRPFSSGFADYGMRDDIDDTIFKLKTLLDGKGLRRGDKLFETMIHPGSRDITFEIISLGNGIRLQNTGYFDQNYNPITPSIDINRQYYGELFKTLLLQAQAALGRTSPKQLIKLIIGVKQLLAN